MGANVRRTHRPQRPRRHGPGPGEERRRAAGSHDRRTVEEFQDAGPVHRAPGGGPGGGGAVLPGGRGLEPFFGLTTKDADHEGNGTIRKATSSQSELWCQEIAGGPKCTDCELSYRRSRYDEPSLVGHSWSGAWKSFTDPMCCSRRGWVHLRSAAVHRVKQPKISLPAGSNM